MKNKKFLMGLFVIVALLCLGIGYAAVTKTLTINGTISTGEITDNDIKHDFIVEFDQTAGKYNVVETPVNAGNTDLTGSVTFENELTAIINVEGMKNVGDKVVFTLTVVNKSADLMAQPFDYTQPTPEQQNLRSIQWGVSAAQPLVKGDTYVSPEVAMQSGSLFQVTVDWTMGLLNYDNIAAGGEQVYTVTVEMIGNYMPNSADDIASSTLTIKLGYNPTNFLPTS